MDVNREHSEALLQHKERAVCDAAPFIDTGHTDRGAGFITAAAAFNVGAHLAVLLEDILLELREANGRERSE